MKMSPIILSSSRLSAEVLAPDVEYPGSRYDHSCTLRQVTLDEILIEYPFSCALSRKKLALIPEENLSGFTYMYQLPSDCLYIKTLLEAEEETFVELESEPFLKEGDVLYCNLSPCAIKFVKRVDVKYLSPHVAEALVLKLACKSAKAITGRSDREDSLYMLFEAAIRKAKTIDGIENRGKYFSTERLTEDR